MSHFQTIVKKRVIKYLSAPNWQTVKIPVGNTFSERTNHRKLRGQEETMGGGGVYAGPWLQTRWSLVRKNGALWPFQEEKSSYLKCHFSPRLARQCHQSESFAVS